MLKQEQKLQQRQTLSPQQIQVIRLIELSEIELEEQIKQELIDNPALEESEEHPAGENDTDTGQDPENDDETESSEDLLMGDYKNEDDIPSYLERDYQSSGRPHEEIPFSGGTTFHDHLTEQLQLRDISEEERKIAEYIIGNIDDNGYLQRSLPSISDDLLFQADIDVPVEKLQELLLVIQDFDPAGVGASTLQECLLLQLKRRDTEAARTAYKIVEQAFEAFGKHHYEKIARQFNLTDEAMKAAIQEIAQLNPKPGGSWNDTFAENMNRINPDFIVDENDGELTLSLNNGNMPALRVSRAYNDMLADYAGNKANRTRERRDALLFIKQKIDSAQSFINAVQQRRLTLTATMQAILERQRDFFLTGDESLLRPMILRDIAERTGYDISTISRATSNKYVQTDFGIYPLKYFFSESMQNEAGDEFSAREIKRWLQESIENEDKQAPLTDDRLCELLGEKGYTIARRTVAKYREQLGIPVARLRKQTTHFS